MSERMVDDSGKIIYANVIKSYPWIVEKGHKCILSPDSDGLLCGLLMQHLLDWSVCGFYDGKVMLLKNGIRVRECVFLDMEIFRSFVRSIGQHMLMWKPEKDVRRPEWANFQNCISPNNMRLFGGNPTQKKFSKKYPLATIHLLLAIIGSQMQIAIKDDAICPLLYTDGTFKNMFNYPGNVLDWLDFLCANDVANPLHKVFYNNCYSTNKLMLALRDFFAAIKAIGGTSRGGDKIVISNSRSRGPENLDQDGSRFKLNGAQVEIANKFLSMLAEQTGWGYRPEKWAFGNFNVFQFEKGTIKPNGRNYEDMLRRKPLSWAMTSGQAIEYTVEGPDRLA